MANKTLFGNGRNAKLAKTDTRNRAGGAAYRFGPRHALAQYAATGCLNGTFYADAELQLQEVLALCTAVEPEFIARTAMYSRKIGFMKDLPALLVAVLSVRGPGLMAEVFDRVIDTPKMLRNFVQIMRSGAVGRKSLGTLPKRMIVQWIEKRTDEQLFAGSVGSDPSLADIIRMVHPKPANPNRAAMLGYLIGREYDAAAMPEIVRAFERYKRNTNPGRVPIPDVPFQMLTALELSDAEWKAIARNASWQTTRMNLNTYQRHGVFQDETLTTTIADRLRDPAAIARARVFPYQLMTAYANAAAGVPLCIREALQDAMEIATANVPRIDGKIYVFPDVSGSMHSPVTGHRKGASSKVRCVDVAALVAAAMLRANPQTTVIPFETVAIAPETMQLNPRDSVMTNAAKLSAMPGGGTNCSAPLALLNQRKMTGDLIIYVSDNESWVDSSNRARFGGNATQTLQQWDVFKKNNPQARMVCIDMQPNRSTQAPESDDVINVGGFSDEVFRLIAAVARGEARAGHWVEQIHTTQL